MGRPTIWTNRMQAFLEENIDMKITDIADLLQVSDSLVQHKRTEILRLKGFEKSKPVTQLQQRINQRPKAVYSNRSPYGIASPGLEKY